VARIKYNIDVMKYISLFESLTGAKLKDCIADDNVTFIVQENEMGKAIGKKGINIKKIESVLKKKIRLIEFNSNISQFVANLTYPFKAQDVKEEDGVVIIYGPDTKTKGMIIGRDRHNIKWINDIVKRYFDVKEVKVD
jgi:N utilization substance protein A|tara:strand:+ start:175 stop:588 length:414 start_codon:yes stop_codon:yes gene_type:complete